LLAATARPFFAGAQSTEIFGGFWNSIGKQLKGQSARWFPADADVKKNAGVASGHGFERCDT
jgi:hypothetical protein